MRRLKLNHKLSLICSCGDTMTGSVFPESAAQRAIGIFREVHSHPECTVTDRSEARSEFATSLVKEAAS